MHDENLKLVAPVSTLGIFPVRKFIKVESSVQDLKLSQRRCWKLKTSGKYLQTFRQIVMFQNNYPENGLRTETCRKANT